MRAPNGGENVVRLVDLSPAERDVVLALIDAKKAAGASKRGESMMALATMASVEIPQSSTKRWTFEMVRVRDLKVDHFYHDEHRFQERRARALAATFDIEKAGAVTISERVDGSRWIIDGQHRIAAARIAGLEHIPARVFRGVTRSEEADIFIGLNETSKLKFSSEWVARVALGDESAVAVMATLERHGVRLVTSGPHTSPNTTKALQRIEALYKVGVLDATLTTARKAWPEDRHALDETVLSGVGGFIGVYRAHPRYDGERLVKKLAEQSAAALIRRARDLTTSSVGYGGLGSPIAGRTGPRAAVLEAYNRRLRDPFPAVTMSDIRRLLLGQNPWV